MCVFRSSFNPASWLGDSASSAGVRRIEALTGESALAFVQQTARVLSETAYLLKDKTRAVPARVSGAFLGRLGAESGETCLIFLRPVVA